MFDVTLGQASAWFDVFNVVLVCGAIAVAVGTYGAIIMGQIKERFGDERIGANEAATAVANKDAAYANERAAGLERETALAKERAAELEKTIAQANARAAEAQLELERFKAPRSIGVETERAIVAHLHQFASTSVTVWLWRGSSTEAGLLAARLRSVLLASQWSVTGPNSLLGGQSGAGVLIAIREKPTNSDERAAQALLQELQAANIDAQIQGGVTDDPVSVLGAFVGETASPPANIWIIVGSKP